MGRETLDKTNYSGNKKNTSLSLSIMESNEKKSKRPRIGQIRTVSPERDVNHENNSDASGESQQRPYRQDYQGGYQQRNNYGQRPYNQRPYNQGGYQPRPRYNSLEGAESTDNSTDSKPVEQRTEGENQIGGYRQQQGYNPNYRRNQGYNQGYNHNGYNNRQGGYNNNRQGGYNNRDNEGGYNNRQGGYNNNRQGAYNNRQGGYNNNRQGGYNNQNRQGSYNNRQGGYNNQNRQGSYNNRQGGYNNQNRQNRPGGYNNRQGGMRQNQFGMPQGGKSFVPRPKRIEYEQSIPSPDEQIRLNKFLANAGLCSRREADEYIQQGLVKVNGETVTELGTKITHSDTVEYNGKAVALESKCYILLNKPKDCVTTSDDPNGRTTVMDLIKGACEERVYPVGRLDRNTTGVLLLTNDGDLASKLTHPKYIKKKIYHVWTDKDISEDDMQRIADGIELDDGPIHADAISYATDTDRNQAGIEIHSGRNRIVRRIFESLGYHVTKLDRVYFAGLTKKNLPRGRWRYLTQEEVNFLKMGSFE